MLGLQLRSRPRARVDEHLRELAVDAPLPEDAGRTIDATGKVVASKQGWPAGTSNIEPGKSVDFDLGRLFRYTPDMQDYTVVVSDVKAW